MGGISDTGLPVLEALGALVSSSVEGLYKLALLPINEDGLVFVLNSLFLFGGGAPTRTGLGSLRHPGGYPGQQAPRNRTTQGDPFRREFLLCGNPEAGLRGSPLRLDLQSPAELQGQCTRASGRG